MQVLVIDILMAIYIVYLVEIYTENCLCEESDIHNLAVLPHNLRVCSGSKFLL
jgi:hypothetical protein